jgi:hypothetical protein
VYTLTYSYTGPLLRRYYLRELWRSHGGFLLCLPFAVVVAIAASRSPDYSWFAGFLGGLCLAYVALIYYGFRQVSHYVVGEPVTITIGEAGVHFDAAWIVSDVTWRWIKSVRRSKDGLIVTSRSRQQVLLIPADVLTDEITSFVIRKMKERRDDGA